MKYNTFLNNNQLIEFTRWDIQFFYIFIYMKALYTKEEFNKAKLKDKLSCECYICSKPFLVKKHSIMYALKGTRDYAKYCSKPCQSIGQIKRQKCNCLNCGLEFGKKIAEFKRSKKHFCSQSCSVSYNNTHKKTGTRRSKLEIYLEQQLTILYPALQIDYNKKDTINSELDIYIPSLKLAVELNGIYHYEPIHGQNKLEQIQNNDQRKFQACLEKNIELLLIDVSGFKHWKEEKANFFLKIIVQIINDKKKVLEWN